MEFYDRAFKRFRKFHEKGQFLMFYGPFKIGNKHTSLINYLFDDLLKMKNDLWCIRNLEEVIVEAKKNGCFKRI